MGNVSDHFSVSVYGVLRNYFTRNQPFCCCKKKLSVESFECFPGGAVVKNLPANARDTGDTGSLPESGRSHGEGNGSPLQYFCLENPHGQRILKGYSPWGHKESDVT